VPLATTGTFSTAASPSGRFIIIHSLDPTPRLIEVPLKPDVTGEDIHTIFLQQTAS